MHQCDCPTLSIITTVYRVRDYLPQTVASILNQTFTDFELILVEDGCPDGCGALCDQLAQQDKRIRVIHKPNGGPASAANVGLRAARGRYMGFVNGDDCVEPTLYETLYQALQDSGVRIAACSGDCIDEEGKPAGLPDVTIRTPGVMDAQRLLLEAFQTGSFYGPLSWNKLFDIRTFRDKGVKYDETMHFGDDASVLHRVFEGEQVVCLSDVLYHYRMRRGQITQAGQFSPRRLDDLKMYWNWLCYFSAQPQRAAEYRPWAVVRYYQLFYTLWHLAHEAGAMPGIRRDFTPALKHLRSLWRDFLTNPHWSAPTRLRAVLFAFFPNVIYQAACLWGRLVKCFSPTERR